MTAPDVTRAIRDAWDAYNRDVETHGTNNVNREFFIYGLAERLAEYAAAAVAEERAACIRNVLAEAVCARDTKHPSDDAYNQAFSDAVRAIKQRASAAAAPRRAGASQ